MSIEEEYLEMINDTTQLISERKALSLSSSVCALSESDKLVNEVEFWKWMGENYPRNLGNTEMIQQTAIDNGQWLCTQIQGKGYEWDYMVMQRSMPGKVLSTFDAGNSPTQPGIDITEKGLIDNKVRATYQNKAYLSSNNPNLSNTPKDAIVVTNSEKVPYAQKQGYQTDSYMDNQKIKDVRDERYQNALEGKVNASYNIKNVVNTSAKAGVVAAVIGMTTETVISYKAWKNGKITDEQYINEVLKAGGEAGVTGAATTAILVPVKAALAAAGASSLIAIPIGIVLGAAIDNVVAPCFGRGKYRQILGEAKYYQALEDVYDDFIFAVDNSAKQYENYVRNMQNQIQTHEQMKVINNKLNQSLKDLYESI